MFATWLLTNTTAQRMERRTVFSGLRDSCLLKQDRQCTCNVTLRHVRATIAAVEKQWALHNMSVWICSLSYLAWNAYAPYCHLWPASLCNIFPHYLINGTNFEEKALNTKCVFLFSLQRLTETFFILRRNERHMIKMHIGVDLKYPLLLSDFNETWIFSIYFRKILK
jgi:hypothetical protein